MKKVILLSLLIAWLSCTPKRQPIVTGFEGKPLPAFSLLLTDSSTYINTSEIPLGKPLVLFYFSPRCPYCRAQMDDIIKNISSLQDIRFYVFTTWPFPEMKAFYNHYHLNKYSNIIVGADFNNYFKAYYKTKGVPFTAIYNTEKRLKNSFIGEVYSKQIQEIAEN